MSWFVSVSRRRSRSGRKEGGGLWHIWGEWREKRRIYHLRMMGLNFGRSKRHPGYEGCVGWRDRRGLPLVGGVAGLVLRQAPTRITELNKYLCVFTIHNWLLHL